LEWEALKRRLLPYLKTEKAKKELTNLEPHFDKNKALLFREKAEFLFNKFEKGKPLILPPLPHLEEIFEKAKKRGFFLPKEITALFNFINTSFSLKEPLANSPFSEFAFLVDPLSSLQEKIKEIFELEREDLKDRASYQLFLIRKEKRELEEELFSRLERLKDFYWKKGYLQEEIYLFREGRYVLPVKPEFKNKVKGAVRGFSQSGHTIFIEPLSIIDLANQLEELIWKEEREIVRILREFSQEVFSSEETFLKLEKLLAELDLTLAKVELGRFYRGVFPEIVEEGPLILEEAFHPLLYFRALEKDLPYPVPNNYYLERALMITGPNLGGKTVTLKTIGISVLMALNGFLIPAKRARIPAFSQILVDLGDEQDLWEGESSFSSHLKNLKRILDKADNKTLVLLDEPGRGTNPEEGACLVWSIIEKVLEKGAYVAVTTHSHFLKAEAVKRGDFLLARVEFDKSSLSPTYKLLYGYLGESHAFELARKIGLSEEVLERAKALLTNRNYFELEERYEEEIRKVEQLRKEYEEKLRALQREREVLEKLKKDLQEKYEGEIKNLREKLLKEFQKFLKELEIEKIEKKKIKAFEGFKNFLEKSISFSGEPLKEGDRVFIESLKQEGKIIKIKEGRAEVLRGNIKLEVPLFDLRKIEESGQNLKDFKYEKRAFLSSLASKKEVLNLLGEDVESALYLLEKKLNECFLQGKRELLVIHGHGTGKLRQAVREYLSSHPLVESLKPAEPHEGGNGATKVYLYSKD